MRDTKRRRILKALRRARHDWRALTCAIEKSLRQGGPVEAALCSAITSESLGHFARGMAARILSIGRPDLALNCLFHQLWSQDEKLALWSTGLSIEELRDARAIRPLIRALYDTHPHRQHAAARALGWVHPGSTRAGRVLTDILADGSQPQPVREEAAESLAYQNSNRAIPALLAAMQEPDERIRFWATFALGQLRNRHSWRQSDPRVVPALEARLGDHVTPEGQFNSVAQEALEALAYWNPSVPKYVERLKDETERILSEPGSTEKQRAWARNR
ncbi:HEAT repeat domain-containing protein [Paludibaculum fermentans]|uniref:HEAT repeat domain-containing protein n=1 Tax=Paludibaculum fermentans TaxID=1473598 RepID=UPI003EBBDA15